MQAPLTPKQQTLLDYLRKAIRRQGRMPSLRQAAADLGVSHTAVAHGLKALEAKGHIKREGRYSRTVHLLNREQEAAGVHRWREVPIVGRITAGLPMYAQQEWDGAVVVDGSVFTGDGLFVLKVRGDSMRDAGILDGDLAICQPRQYAENGEIVVALVHDEEATVKRFFLHADHIELRPENPDYPVLRYGFDEVLIQGKVVGLQRGPDSALWRPGQEAKARSNGPADTNDRNDRAAH
ncbi:MAG TPA: transcriptional repressor LexA [Desulfosarcina sp.]|nr:transcriptional repressor LexA [Desulfosarcina sp.]